MNSAAAIPTPAAEAVMEKGPDPAAFAELVRVYRRWEAEHPVVVEGQVQERVMSNE